MEENVALDSSKQKKFVKSIKGIKKLIQKTKSDVPEDVVPKPKDKKKPKRKRPDRGLVYLSHIPHGFYEHEMTQYFKQFGAVSNVRVIRSKRTGNSKGFAFVEFKQPAVAEIVAETMNNYLMGKRLIKAAYVPPEKQKTRAMRMHWSRFNNPGRTEQLKHKKAYNETKTNEGEISRARKTYQTYKKNMKRISDLGINYDFFTPVDIPEELLESNDSQKIDKVDGKSKKNKETVKKDTKEKKTDKATEPEAVTKKNTVKVQNVQTELKKAKKVAEPVVNKKEQKQKQQKLKEAGVKPPENFIKVQDDESDSSDDDFNSDDYTKALENDSDVESGDETDEDSDEEGDDSDNEPGSNDEFEITGSEDDDSEVEESEEEQVLPPKKVKSKSGPIAPPAPVSSKKLAKDLLLATKEVLSKNSKQKGKAKLAEKVPQQKGPKSPELGKRKAPQKIAVSPKKPKFEKQTQQPMKKQFKKKK